MVLLIASTSSVDSVIFAAAKFSNVRDFFLSRVQKYDTLDREECLRRARDGDYVWAQSADPG
jgi:hypothetical protein